MTTYDEAVTIYVVRVPGRPGYWRAQGGGEIGDHGDTTREQAIADAEAMAQPGDEIVDDGDE